MMTEMQGAEKIVAAYAALVNAPTVPLLPAVAPTGGKVAIFAPHPDDECIMGALPLRLQREAGLRIVNVPVTLGSKPERHTARKIELAAACAALGFLQQDLSAHGLTAVRPETASTQPILWDGMVGKVAALLQQMQPQVIFVPHRQDGHPTHIGTHHLVMAALAKLPADFSALVGFTEFWHPQLDANLMVESAVDDVIQLVAALQCHGGEIARNPYDRALPAWFIDNARRGAELVGGFRAAAPFAFATLYRLGCWREARYVPFDGKLQLPATQSAAALLALAP